MGKKKKKGHKRSQLEKILLATAILNTITAVITLIITIMQLV